MDEEHIEFLFVFVLDLSCSHEDKELLVLHLVSIVPWVLERLPELNWGNKPGDSKLIKYINHLLS